MAAFSENIFREDNFEAVQRATRCCYDYGANSSEAVEKVTTDQKHYYKMMLQPTFIFKEQYLTDKD